MSNDSEEKVRLLDQRDRISPSSREVNVVFDATPAESAWPQVVAGTIVGGLTDTDALRLIPSEVSPGAELYLTHRITLKGQGRRYILTELQKSPEGSFRFNARRDFDTSFPLERG